jgi:hypothetical protein
LPLTRHGEGRGAMRERLSVLVMAAFLLFVVSACGGGGGDQGEGGGGEQAKQEQAKVRKIPDYGDLPPGKYVTDEFEPDFSFEVVGKGWVLTGSEERTIVEMSQGVAGPLLSIVVPEKVFDPKRVSEMASIAPPEDVAAWLRGHPYLEIEDSETAAIGGVEGEQIDAVVPSVPETECGGNCLGLFAAGDGAYDWVVFEEEKLHFTVLEDVGGKRVVVALEAKAKDFEGFLPKAQGVLETVKWEDA